MSLIQNWLEVIRTSNLSPDKEPDLISRWLIITRAAVTTMTLTSGLVGGLLAAVLVSNLDWFNFTLALTGLFFAHISNNLTNDYFDMKQGVDTDEYTRALYAPHPVLSGFLTEKGLIAATMVCNLIDLAIMILLIFRVGWPVLVFALSGLFISVFYVAPPLKLKHHGLGEPAVFLIWGPLITGGTYFVTAGEMPGLVMWLACIPYALLVTTVLIGKHIDKYEQDSAKGIHTLPVILGKQVSLTTNIYMMILFYLVIAVIALLGMIGPWVALVCFALPRLRAMIAIYRQPKPAEPPEGYPNWPLWYVSAAFYHARLAGGLFVLGLILNAVVPVIVMGG